MNLLAIQKAATAHAQAQLGKAQFTANADARRAIEEDFIKGSLAFRTVVQQVLTNRYAAAHARFQDDLAKNGAEDQLDGAEAADEISQIARELDIAIS